MCVFTPKRLISGISEHNIFARNRGLLSTRISISVFAQLTRHGALVFAQRNWQIGRIFMSGEDFLNSLNTNKFEFSWNFQEPDI